MGRAGQEIKIKHKKTKQNVTLIFTQLLKLLT